MQLDHTRCVVQQPDELATSDWTSFLYSLEPLLGRVAVHGRAFAVLRVDRVDDAFVQLCVTRDGLVTAEAATSLFRPGCCRSPARHRLTVDQACGLRRLGWTLPDDHPGGRQLWHRDADPRWMYVAPLYAELLTRTLVEVFEVDSPERVNVKVGNMPRQTDGLALVEALAA